MGQFIRLGKLLKNDLLVENGVITALGTEPKADSASSDRCDR